MKTDRQSSEFNQHAWVNLPNSLLAHYLAHAVQEFGTEDSCY
ncbi:hypothetical protein [Bacillus sp. B15-48]|nr:hypothetical protein [Bacillus sp. B15-48]